MGTGRWRQDAQDSCQDRKPARRSGINLRALEEVALSVVPPFGRKSLVYRDLPPEGGATNYQLNCFTSACICLNSGVPAGHNSNSAISIDEMIAPTLAILSIANSRFLASLVETASLSKCT